MREGLSNADAWRCTFCLSRAPPSQSQGAVTDLPGFFARRALSTSACHFQVACMYLLPPTSRQPVRISARDLSAHSVRSAGLDIYLIGGDLIALTGYVFKMLILVVTVLRSAE